MNSCFLIAVERILPLLLLSKIIHLKGITITHIKSICNELNSSTSFMRNFSNVLIIQNKLRKVRLCDFHFCCREFTYEHIKRFNLETAYMTISMILELELHIFDIQSYLQCPQWIWASIPSIENPQQWSQIDTASVTLTVLSASRISYLSQT